LPSKGDFLVDEKFILEIGVKALYLSLKALQVIYSNEYLSSFFRIGTPRTILLGIRTDFATDSCSYPAL